MEADFFTLAMVIFGAGGIAVSVFQWYTNRKKTAAEADSIIVGDALKLAEAYKVERDESKQIISELREDLNDASEKLTQLERRGIVRDTLISKLQKRLAEYSPDDPLVMTHVA